MSYHRGNQCWIPYQIGQRYTKSLAYCWWGWFCPFYSNVCTPLLVYSEWFCGDVQPTDQVTHWPVVLVGISGSFCAKTRDAFYLVNQFLKQRVGWGSGGASARVTVLFWNTIAREMGYPMGFLSLSFLQLEYDPGFHLWSLAALPQSSLHTKKMLRVASVCSGSGLLMAWWDLGTTRNMRCKASCISLWNFSIFSQLEYIPWKAQLTCPSISCMLIITSNLRNGNLGSFFSLIPIFSRKVLSSEDGCQEGTGHSFESLSGFLGITTTIITILIS